MANAYAFNPDRSKAPVYTKEEVDAMDLVNDQALAQEVADRVAAVSIVDARIDTIIANPLTEETAIEELVDIRTGYDGIEYDTAGNAVRGQVFDLRNDINAVLTNDNIYNDATLQKVSLATANYTKETGWIYPITQPSVISNDEFCNAFSFANASPTAFYLSQDLQTSKFSAGTYTIKFKSKASLNAEWQASIVGYPTAANSGGTTLGHTGVKTLWKSDEYVDNFGTLTITDPSSYNHIRVSLYLANSSNVQVTKLVLSRNSNDVFSFIDAKLNNPLFGKKICLSGDSICYGLGYSGGYGKIIAERNNMSYQNIAVAGATLASGTTDSGGNNRYWISEGLSSLDNDGDYYIIEGGFNDSGNNVNPNAEAYTDVISTTQPSVLTNTVGAMENLCYELVVNHRGKKIGFVFPHKIYRNEWTVEANNAYNYTWGQYKELQKKILKKWGVPYIDLAECSGMDTIFPDISSAYTVGSDKVHPNFDGYVKYYVPKIEAWMKTL